MKKLVLLLMALTAAALLSISASATEYPTGVSGEAAWTLKGDTMYITGQGILSGVSNADCQPWEYFQDEIRHVVIEDGVTLIGDVIFAHTYNLQTVTIADSVTEICEGAFRNCYALKDVKLSANLQTLGNFAFAYCENLGPVELPDTLTKLGESVFTGCSAMSGIRLPGDLYEIGQMNFDSCMSLTEVTIPAGVGFLRHASFPNCFNLKKVVFEGDMPYTNGDPFYMGPEDLVIYCYTDAKGWDEPLFYTYPVVKVERGAEPWVGENIDEKPSETVIGGAEHPDSAEIYEGAYVPGDPEVPMVSEKEQSTVPAGVESTLTTGAILPEGGDSFADNGENHDDSSLNTMRILLAVGGLLLVFCFAVAFTYVRRRAKR